MIMDDFQGRQMVIGRYFTELIKPIQPWMMQMLAAYKEQGDYPLFPTFIEGYYQNSRDKEIALVSTLCMNWERNIYQQVTDMRHIMGDSPWEWFSQRLFTTISTGKNQNKTLDCCMIKYWQIARLFDMLYTLWKQKGRPPGLKKCFYPRRTAKAVSAFESFAEVTSKAIHYSRCTRYKANVIELVMRTSDGIGVGLWGECKAGDKCPRSGKVRKFLKMWVNDYSVGYWDFDTTIRWFGFKRDADFFYFWMAWTRLSRISPKECSRFSTVFWNRYDERKLFSERRWRDFLPTINFKNE